MKILGLSFFYHDSAAALLCDGVPVAMAEEERFSRIKHDYGFPKRAIDFVLEEGGCAPGDIDYVVFYEKPFIKFDRVFKTLLWTFPWAPHVFAKAVKSLFLSKIWIRALIAKELGIDHKKILFTEHHLSHAAASYLSSPHEKAAILTIDGVGEWACAAIGAGEKNKINIIKEIHFPHSLGLLYSAFTAFLGFEVNEGEYKVMGMAPYGEPKYVDKVKKLITFFDDGSYALHLEYFSFYKSNSRTYSREFINLFGRPRDPKSKFFTRETGWPAYFGEKPEGKAFQKLAEREEYYADLAASLQKVTEEAVVRLAREAHRVTGAKALCLGGGVALNSVANWKIVEQTPFEDVYIQPAAGDAGGALGAALLTHAVLGGERNFVMKKAYYGKSYSREEIKKYIEEKSLKAEFFEDENDLTKKVAEEIADGKVVGWFQGRFEWGPRALGNRSILADPRRADMKDIVNTKIKFREPYRPFAPSVLAEYAEEYFEIPNAKKHYPARFMLYVVPVKKEKREIVPAITHVDGTARPQLVFEEESPRYSRLIRAFAEKTGVPLIMNTSFNLKGEPIVNTPEEAYSTFMRSGLDVLVLENFVIFKESV
ncbi:MAG: carbamoyltransferase N-terminal domain-containing protein [Nanoarchaeota archaeon]|nr:carbamoyltransferase N-terminal domain-containing protein [Nanoarchaeota archaeon]